MALSRPIPESAYAIGNQEHTKPPVPDIFAKLFTYIQTNRNDGVGVLMEKLCLCMDNELQVYRSANLRNTIRAITGRIAVVNQKKLRMVSPAAKKPNAKTKSA
jgi:hypothetical protein